MNEASVASFVSDLIQVEVEEDEELFLSKLETRAYLLEILPNVLQSLERLLVQIERTDVINGAIQSPLSCASPIEQMDHMPLPFDPILWLAQDLYRNKTKPIYGGLCMESLLLASKEISSKSQSLRSKLQNQLDLEIQMRKERMIKLQTQLQEKLNAKQEVLDDVVELIVESLSSVTQVKMDNEEFVPCF